MVHTLRGLHISTLIWCVYRFRHGQWQKAHDVKLHLEVLSIIIERITVVLRYQKILKARKTTFRMVLTVKRSCSTTPDWEIRTYRHQSQFKVDSTHMHFIVSTTTFQPKIITIVIGIPERSQKDSSNSFYRCIQRNWTWQEPRLLDHRLQTNDDGQSILLEINLTVCSTAVE